MPLLPKHMVPHREQLLRDVRPFTQRMAEFWGQTNALYAVSLGVLISLIAFHEAARYADLLLVLILLYTRWLYKRPFALPFKLPRNSGLPDPHNPKPGKGGAGKADGILYLGNLDEAPHPDHGRELWLTNADARTHILFLGTTGSGKTEGLKSIICNALTWGSGFVYVDGKADTDLWASLFALTRRFGRDDDILVLNYMTANSDEGAVSNTMNPFSNGSASYLTNMIVNLMPDAGGDNAMWKERAISLMGALMPALTWKRDKQGLLLDVSVLRDYIELPAIIKLSRDPNLPERIIRALQGYLNTLPGYIDAAFDDEGNERPPSPDQPMYDLQVARQQHGYLSMQFTRSLQSLGDEYGYIFKSQLADIDVLDVVLNRRVLVALIPALEKSSDEAANLGKIIAASLKGMMGATLGNTVEGSWENAIGSKQTRSASSFMTVFDEVGYYTAQGMAVMAAQARSLGFSLIFAAQDLPSMEKRVKQEAQSILGNCNLKIFGKLEDPGETKKFFQDHVGGGFVMENRGMTANHNTIGSLFMTNQYIDEMGASSVGTRVRADYDHLRGQREGEVHMLFAEYIVRARMFYAQPDKVEALRVHKFLPVPGTTTKTAADERMMNEIAARLKNSEWTAAAAARPAVTSSEIAALSAGWASAAAAGKSVLEAGALALAGLAKQIESAPAEKAPPLKADRGSFAARMDQVRAEEDAENERAAAMEKAIMGKPHLLEQAAAPAVQDTSSMLSGFGDDNAPLEMTASTPFDIDMDIVPRTTVLDDDIADIVAIDLPDDLQDLVRDVAGKLNEALNTGDSSGAAGA